VYSRRCETVFGRSLRQARVIILSAFCLFGGGLYHACN